MASSSTRWTSEQDKRFERALATYERDTPDKWEKVAAMVGGGKSAADVKRHYDLLLEDIHSIESGRVPFPKYRNSSASFANAGRLSDDDRRRLAYLKI